ncbi:17493_t:CDS:2 [Racocetra fulgida]|uniref:17493_t:CDS:1 n=1 Tax=Racocetra fulgida TaxID=60492 RepID=A0A9N9ARX2_9GLOM|nr:17493_t:CDS:2 [Racocetra fulgida]
MSNTEYRETTEICTEISEDGTNRFRIDDESELRTNNTSVSTDTVTNHVTATAPNETVTNNTHVSTGSSTIVPSATTDDAKLRRREKQDRAKYG